MRSSSHTYTHTGVEEEKKGEKKDKIINLLRY